VTQTNEQQETRSSSSPDAHPWIPSWLTNIPLVGRPAVALLNDRRVRYVMAGGVTAVIYYGFFSALFLPLGERLHYLLIMVVANFLTTVAAYPLYRHGVYQVQHGGWGQFFRFYLTCLWALVFGLVVMPLLVEVVKLPVMLAQAIVIVVFPLINYQLQRRWAFRRPNP
jgi:putative flippase GtrA